MSRCLLLLSWFNKLCVFKKRARKEPVHDHDVLQALYSTLLRFTRPVRYQSARFFSASCPTIFFCSKTIFLEGIPTDTLFEMVFARSCFSFPRIFFPQTFLSSSLPRKFFEIPSINYPVLVALLLKKKQSKTLPLLKHRIDVWSTPPHSVKALHVCLHQASSSTLRLGRLRDYTRSQSDKAARALQHS